MADAGFCAVLTRADLHGADLHGANLRGANLTDANLSSADLVGVFWSVGTKWPDELAESMGARLRRSSPECGGWSGREMPAPSRMARWSPWDSSATT
jgi:Pentapeptide repeats (8 copies)